ncbi:hypothetical protein HanIR_Chr08g0380431 [Helianthus annuus]|nr:hypothetical protein HanIR_Chr08g0380431 [Helianthus annuus]
MKNSSKRLTEIGQEDRVLRTPIRVGDAAPMVYIDWKLWHAH